MDKEETYFVTGATGFIGSKLMQALVERGRRVRALTRREKMEPPPGTDHTWTSPFEHPLVEPVLGDITDRDSVLEGMRGCQRVFHLAAYAKNWAPEPQTYFQINIGGMRNVFEAAKHHNVQRVVWTSTIVTLGPTPLAVVGDEEMPRSTEKFFTEYEETKTLAEREAVKWAADGLPVVIVNPTRVYGPGYLTEANSLSMLIDDYDRGKFPLLLNRGKNVGNYVLVDDVVQGHMLAMESGRIGQRYILGGQNVTLREFFRIVDRVSNQTHRQVPLPSAVALLFAHLLKQRARWFGIYPTITPGWIKTFLADWTFSVQKAERELGYRPTPLEEGIRQTYQWILKTRPASQ